jgi:CubicO group peptidase (beta-lactamase class C family)
LAFAAGLISVPHLATAQVAADPLAEVDEIFAPFDSDAAPGCAVGMEQGGERILTRAYGMANLEWGIPNTPETIFENGSVSKQFTAAAVVLLTMDGELSLEDDVRDYIPELPDYGPRITLRHLLNHTSGIRDWGSVAGISGWGRGERTHNHDHVLDILSRQSRLNFEPGHEYSYSNSGYNLLAMVVTRVSGTPFAEFSRERIFEPLGMTDTQWRDDYRRIVPGRSVGYSPAGGGYRLNHPIENVHGNGGLLTTVDDLLIWNRSLRDGTLAGPELVEMMETQGVLNDGSTIDYALGLTVSEVRGVKSVSHGGATSGYRAFLVRYPEQDLSVALLCNAANANPGGLAQQVAELALEDLDPEPELPDGVAVDPAVLETRAGMYRDVETGVAVTITVGPDGKLLRGNTPLVPASESEFHVGTSGSRAIWEAGASGERTGFRVESADGRVVDRLEPVEPVELWNENVEEYLGAFRSPDAEVTLTFELENDALVINRRPSDRAPLRPAYKDAFFTPIGFLRFVRDEAGEIEYATIHQSRVYDMRFYREEG